MQRYKDSTIEATCAKLTYFDIGFGVHPVLALLTPSPEKITFQERLLNERLLAYLDLKGTHVEYNIYFSENHQKACILYYLYMAGRRPHKVFLHQSTKPEALLQEDLLKQKCVNLYDSFDELVRSAATKLEPTLFVIDLKKDEDLRPYLDYLSIQRDSIIMVLNYSEKSSRNERLYAMKSRVRLLEHIDQSADFIPF